MKMRPTDPWLNFTLWIIPERPPEYSRDVEALLAREDLIQSVVQKLDSFSGEADTLRD